jgi:hypothetical protein
MRGKMILNPDFKEFFQLLNDNNVQYLIVGGYAEKGVKSALDFSMTLS